jgi:hypothetical protein
MWYISPEKIYGNRYFHNWHICCIALVKQFIMTATFQEAYYPFCQNNFTEYTKLILNVL